MQIRANCIQHMAFLGHNLFDEKGFVGSFYWTIEKKRQQKCVTGQSLQNTGIFENSIMQDIKSAVITNQIQSREFVMDIVGIVEQLHRTRTTVARFIIW